MTVLEDRPRTEGGDWDNPVRRMSILIWFKVMRKHNLEGQKKGNKNHM